MVINLYSQLNGVMQKPFWIQVEAGDRHIVPSRFDGVKTIYAWHRICCDKAGQDFLKLQKGSLSLSSIELVLARVVEMSHPGPGF